MRGLIFLTIFGLVAPAFADEPAAKIDDYQRQHPSDPRQQAPEAPPVATDRTNATAKPLPGDAEQAQSAAEQQKYVSSVQRALETWDKRIEDLDKKPSTQAAAKILRTLRIRTNADLAELGKVKGKAWLDVKARIESRFRRMAKEYDAVKA